MTQLAQPTPSQYKKEFTTGSGGEFPLSTNVVALPLKVLPNTFQVGAYASLSVTMTVPMIGAGSIVTATGTGTLVTPANSVNVAFPGAITLSATQNAFLYINAFATSAVSGAIVGALQLAVTPASVLVLPASSTTAGLGVSLSTQVYSPGGIAATTFTATVQALVLGAQRGLS